MSQQLSWSREGETLKLSGELDQDLLNPLWDKRHEAMQGVTVIDLTDVTRVDTAGVALLAHLVAVGGERHASRRERECRDSGAALQSPSGRTASLIFSVRYFRKP